MALIKVSLKGHTKAAAAEVTAAEMVAEAEAKAEAEAATTATVIKTAAKVEDEAKAATTAEMETEGTNKEEEVKTQVVGAQARMLLARSTRSQSISNKVDSKAGIAGEIALVMCSPTILTQRFTREC